MQVDLSIIYVNWNSVGYLRESIASVYEYTRERNFEIIVVDNASPDGGVEVLHEYFPNISIVKSTINLGFSGGNNLGYRHSSGKSLLFLNPDTKLVSPAIYVMLDYLKRLPGVGVIGCKLLNADLSIQTSCIQKFPTILNQITDIEWFRLRWPHCRLWEIGPLFSANEKPARVEMISGACMMLKRNVFEQAGLFSEDYFMYADDLDLSYKVTQKGFHNYYIGDVTIIHYGGKSTTQKANQWATIMKFRAIHKFLVKTRGQIYGASFKLAMACVALGRVALLGLLALLYSGMREKESIRSVQAKWNAVLAWAVGLDNSVLNKKMHRISKRS